VNEDVSPPKTFPTDDLMLCPLPECNETYRDVVVENMLQEFSDSFTDKPCNVTVIAHN
ncbi:hypothetical protein CHS0354_028691, partial [Potamilus streckersoni]